jgi:plastocyanin
VGDILFAHPTVAGKLTNVRPQHDLAVAFITVRNATAGQIAIRIVPGNFHLEWLHDVSINSPSNGQLLSYDDDSDVWINKSAPEIINSVSYSAVTRLDVTSSGTSAYLFNNQYSGNNPTLFATAGTTIGFNLNVPGHPFLIRYQGANYDTGLIHVSTTGVVTTGADAQGKTSGTLYWQLPANISGDYGYLCSVHGSMIGTITVNSSTPTTDPTPQIFMLMGA